MELSFREFGSGEPLVILHGLLGASDNWLGVAPALAERFHLFILDLRNHGQSPHSDTMDFPGMADDVREFMDAHGLTTAHVMGHSLGGKVAMEFALRYPDRVQKLVIEDISPRVYKPIHDVIFSALLSLDLSTFQSRQQVEDALAMKIPSLVMRRFLLKNLGRNPAGGLQWKINVRGIEENYPHLNKAITSSAMFEKPALFVHGGKSNYFTPADEVLIRELFPKAEIQTIPEAGHWVHGDAPQEFVDRVLKFL